MQQNMILDVYSKRYSAQSITGRVSDGGELKLNIKVTAYNDDFDLTGWAIKFEVTTSVGTIAIDSLGAKLTNAKQGEFTYTMPKEIMSVSGKTEHAYFAFEKNGTRITSSDIDITILQVVDMTAEEAKSYIAEYNKLVEQLNKAYKDFVAVMTKQYDAIEQRAKAIETSLATFEKLISDYEAKVIKTASDAQNAINTVKNQAVSTINDLVEGIRKELEKQNFYTKTEIDKVISDLRTEINEKYLSFKDYKINADNTTSMTMRLDFNNKVMGSNVKNPNGYFYVGASVIKQPNEFLYELANTSVSNSYESLNELDSKAVNSFSLKENVITQHLAKFDAVEVLTRKFSKMFDNKTLSEKVKIARSMIANWTFHVWCKGSGQGGNKVTLSAWNGTWMSSQSHESAELKMLGYTKSTYLNCLNDDGNFYFLLNAVASDGIVKSSVQVDYIYLDLALNVPLNAIDFDLNDKVVDLTINDTVVSTVTDIKAKVLNDSLNDVKATLAKKVNILSKGELLWKGLYMMTLSQRITPTKKLSECQNGWRIKWARYTVSTQTVDEAYCVYQYITSQGSCSIMLPHFGASNEWTMKGLSAVTDTYIQGHDLNNNNNNSGSSYKMVAVAVESF